MLPGVSALKGLRVLLTRPVEQSRAWQDALDSCGARVVSYPTITIGPPPSWAELDRAVAELDRYDWVLFSSVSAVRNTLSRLAFPPRLAQDGRQIGAVGEGTAQALRDAGIRVDVVPTDTRGAGLAAALAALRPGTRILFPQTIGGRSELAQSLQGQGCLITVVAASQTLPVESLAPLPPFDVATFASPSALRSFLRQHPADTLRGKPLIVIGPTTADEAHQAGLQPQVARSPTADGLITAIVESL